MVVAERDGSGGVGVCSIALQILNLGENGLSRSCVLLFFSKEGQSLLFCAVNYLAIFPYKNQSIFI